LPAANGRSLSLRGAWTAEYWSEKWQDRTELLGAVISYLTERRWAKVVDPGWSNRDLLIYCHPWTEVRICTVQEDHGSGRRLIRVRFQMWPRGALWLASALALTIAAAMGIWLGVLAGVAVAGSLLVALAGVWWHAARRSGRAVSVFDHAASKLELTCCEHSQR